MTEPVPASGETQRCPVCAGAVVRQFDAVTPPFTKVHCIECGHGSTEPPVGADEIGRWYPPSYYGSGNVRFNPLFEWLTRWFRRRRANVIARAVRPGTILDVGCGRGLTLASLRDAGFTTVGLELSETAAHHAREVLHLDVRTSDFLHEETLPHDLSAIIFWHSLEHFSDPFAALDRAASLLGGGGLLVVAVPNSDSLQAAISERHWFHLDIPRHYVHFTTRSLVDAVERRGFRVETIAHFSLEQNPYGWIQSLLNRIGIEHDLLYSVLKRHHARAHTLRRHPAGTFLSAILAIPLLPLSGVLMLIETALRRGGTIELYARKA